MLQIAQTRFENTKGIMTVRVYDVNGKFWTIIDAHEIRGQRNVFGKVELITAPMLHKGMNANKQFFAESVQDAMEKAETHFNEVFG